MMDYSQVYGELERSQQQLLAMEIELQNAVRKRIIGQKVYKVRQEYLNKLRSRIGNIMMLANQEVHCKEEDLDLGLPEFAACTLEELVVCDYFLSQRLNFCMELFTHFKQLLIWVEEAARGRSGTIRNIFRLAKIKKMMQRLETEKIRQDRDEQVALENSQVLTSKVRGIGQEGYFTSNLRALMKLFTDLNALTERIARLRNSITREEEEMERMRHWLMKYEKQISQIPASSPPTMDEMRRAELLTREAAFDPVKHAETRLQAVRSFVDSCLGDRGVGTHPGRSAEDTRRPIKGATAANNNLIL